MLAETCFEIDFNISAVLPSVDDFASRKKTDSNGNLKSCNLSFSIDSIPNYKLTSGIENDDVDDDLDALLDSCHIHSSQPSGLISLATLAHNHLSNNSSATAGSKLENCLSSSFVTNFKSDVPDEIKLLDCLEDMLLEGESFDYNKTSSTEDFLSTPEWKHLSAENSGINERNEKSCLNKETVDDELIPEINLNFCIKKNNKDTFSTVSSSPESTDSGFYEIDSSSEKCVSSDEAPCWDASTFSADLKKSPLFRPKRSILSRAIGAKPKTDKSRKAKLQNIRSELLKKSIPPAVFKSNQEQNLPEFKMIIDHSDRCVITSSFLEIFGQ